MRRWAMPVLMAGDATRRTGVLLSKLKMAPGDSDTTMSVLTAEVLPIIRWDRVFVLMIGMERIVEDMTTARQHRSIVIHHTFTMGTIIFGI